MTWEIDTQMKRHGIDSPFELTEFDGWANDATRRDINRLIEKHGGRVFGLKLWDFEIRRGEELRDTLNFTVDYIFRAEDEERVKQLIEEYGERQERLKKVGLAGTMEETRRFLDCLENLAVYDCLWV